MKRVVVFLLTAVLITGVCLTPTVVYATASGVVTDDAEDAGGSKGIVDDTDTEEKKDSDADGNKAGISDTDTDSSDADSQESDGNESGITQADDVIDVATVDKDFGELSVAQNLSGVSAYVTSVSTVDSMLFVLKNDIVVLGYNYTKGKNNGFINPDLLSDGSHYITSFGYVDAEEDEVYTDEDIMYNTIEDVVTIDDAIKYVKDNLNSLSMVAGDTGTRSANIDMNFKTDNVLFFDGKTGDFIGWTSNSFVDAEELYDENLMTLKADVDTSLRYSDKKDVAYLTFSFDFYYPEVFGGATLTGFEILSESGDLLMLSSESMEYTEGIIGKSKGTVKDVKLDDSGYTFLKLYTTNGEYTTNFLVDKLNNTPEETVASTKKPNVTFEVHSQSETRGNSVTVTMYSDVDAILMFNGRSSGSAVKKYDFTVSQNGNYSWSATTPDGMTSNGTYSISLFNDSLASSNYGKYGTGSISSLPKTGGINTIAVVMSGLMLVLGGIAVLKKDAMLALISALKRKVSV